MPYPKRKSKYKNKLKVNCFWCDKMFKLDYQQQINRTREGNRGKAGPFCSQRCCALYGNYN